MKKKLFTVLALLTAFTLVMGMMSCSSDSSSSSTKKDQVTVSFEVSYGAYETAGIVGTLTKKKVDKGGSLTAKDITKPANQTAKEVNWEFVDWRTGVFGSGVTITTSTKFDADTTVWAYWIKEGETPIQSGTAPAVTDPKVDPESVLPPKEELVTVEFETNGGSAVGAVQVKIGDKLAKPADPSKYKSTFEGWFTDEGLTAAYDFDTVVTAAFKLYAKWDSVPIPVEELSLANAWHAIFEFELPAGKTWADYDAKLTVDYKLDEATILGGTPRAVRLLGNYLPVEVANPRVGQYIPDGGDPVDIAVVGNWPGGTSNDWIFSQIASSWDAGKIPDVLADWVDDDITPDEWFTVNYPIIPKGEDDSKANGNWNLSGVRNPAATDTGPFYFAVGIPGAGTANTFQITNVILKGKAAADDVVGAPLYYTKDGKKARAFAGQLDKEGDGPYNNARGGNPGWKIISGETGIANKTITGENETVTVSFNVNGGTGTVQGITVSKGELLTHAQLGPSGASKAGNALTGWWTETSGGTKVNSDPTYILFTENTTFYAQWTPLPDATADVVVDVSTAKFSAFGGLGNYDNDAGPGPFDFKDEYQYDACIWIPYPTQINSYIYDHIEIVFTLTRITGSGDSQPMKLAFHNGRPDNAWSGGSDTYGELTSNGDLAIELPVTSLGIAVQHNTYGGSAGNPATGDFELTVKSIKLVAPSDD